MKRVLKYRIRVDDRPHTVPRGVPVLFGRTVANTEPSTVEIWFEDLGGDEDVPMQKVQIVGTGQPVPSTWQWLSSCVDGALVWHLYEVRS